MKFRWRRLTETEFLNRRPGEGPVIFGRHAVLKGQDKIPFVLEIYDENSAPWWNELPVVID